MMEKKRQNEMDSGMVKLQSNVVNLLYFSEQGSLQRDSVREHWMESIQQGGRISSYTGSLSVWVNYFK